MYDAGKNLVVCINEKNRSGIAHIFAHAINVRVLSIRNDRLMDRFCRAIQHVAKATKAHKMNCSSSTTFMLSDFPRFIYYVRSEKKH